MTSISILDSSVSQEDLSGLDSGNRNTKLKRAAQISPGNRVVSGTETFIYTTKR